MPIYCQRCNERTRVKETRSVVVDLPVLGKEFDTLRRRRQCDRCGQISSYYTLELEEDTLLQLDSECEVDE